MSMFGELAASSAAASTLAPAVVSAPRSTNAVLIVPVSVTESIHFACSECQELYGAVARAHRASVFHDPVLFRALAAYRSRRQDRDQDNFKLIETHPYCHLQPISRRPRRTPTPTSTRPSRRHLVSCHSPSNLNHSPICKCSRARVRFSASYHTPLGSSRCTVR